MKRIQQLKDLGYRVCPCGGIFWLIEGVLKCGDCGRQESLK